MPAAKLSLKVVSKATFQLHCTWYNKAS